MHSSFRQSIFEVFENFENLENFQISCSCVNFSVEYTWGISWSNETSKANACLISIINVVEERRLQFQTSVIRNNFQFLRFKQSKKGRAYLARFIFKLFKKGEWTNGLRAARAINAGSLSALASPHEKRNKNEIEIVKEWQVWYRTGVYRAASWTRRVGCVRWWRTWRRPRA